jgi:hypothetical protein
VLDRVMMEPIAAHVPTGPIHGVTIR